MSDDAMTDAPSTAEVPAPADTTSTVSPPAEPPEPACGYEPGLGDGIFHCRV